MKKNIKFISEIDAEGISLKNLKVLVRLDLNVPIIDGKIVDDYRIRKSLATIRFLKERGANIILISHIENKVSATLEPVAKYLNDIGIECIFEKNYKKVPLHFDGVDSNSKIILLENIRIYEGEKLNDKNFAKELASLADIYVNEAFPVSHRAHASVSAITEFIRSYAGIQFEEEIKYLDTALNPDETSRPFLFILGGAKFDTKLPLIEKFITIADNLFIGGAIAHDFYKAKGMDIGSSLISDTTPDLNKIMSSEKLILPTDSVYENTAIMDVGEETISALRERINNSKYILWNGPMGAYETGYKNATLKLAKMISEATKNGTRTVVGGGDTLAAIKELDLERSFTFVSTGGGAMLEYLADGSLPGIDALEKSII